MLSSRFENKAESKEYSIRFMMEIITEYTEWKYLNTLQHANIRKTME